VPARRRSELGLGLTSSTTTPAWRRTTPAFTSELFPAVFATRCTSPIAVKLPVWIHIVRFQIAIDTFAARACGPTAGSGFDHDKRGLVLLGHLSRR
jgi:hypothetical protein